MFTESNRLISVITVGNLIGYSESQKTRGLFNRFFKFSSSAGINFLFFAGCLGVLNWVRSIKLLVSSASAANSRMDGLVMLPCSCQDTFVSSDALWSPGLAEDELQ